MKIAEFLSIATQIAPLSLAMDWDNSGLQLGSPHWDTHKAIICLDVNQAALEAALEAGAGLIVAHHPLIFRPLTQISHPLLLALAQHKIAVVSLHTNLDVAPGGVNHALAARLGLRVLGYLGADACPTASGSDEPSPQADPAFGLGLLCEAAKALSLAQLAQLCHSALKCPVPRLWTAGRPLDATYSRIAICGGAGGSLLKDAATCAEVFISGDISYHSYLEASIPVIDAGHFFTEYPVLDVLAGYIRGHGLPCDVLPMEKHDFVAYSGGDCLKD